MTKRTAISEGNSSNYSSRARNNAPSVGHKKRSITFRSHKQKKRFIYTHTHTRAHIHPCNTWVLKAVLQMRCSDGISEWSSGSSADSSWHDFSSTLHYFKYMFVSYWCEKRWAKVAGSRSEGEGRGWHGIVIFWMRSMWASASVFLQPVRNVLRPRSPETTPAYSFHSPFVAWVEFSDVAFGYPFPPPPPSQLAAFHRSPRRRLELNIGDIALEPNFAISAIAYG